MLLPLALVLAHADPVATSFTTPGCEPLAVTGSVPMEGSTDVAPDTPIAVALLANCGLPLTFSLEDGLGEVESGDLIDSVDYGDHSLFTLALADLEPDTDYTLRLFADGLDERSIPFTTGSGSYAAPLLDSDELTFDVRNSYEPEVGRVNLGFDAAMDAPADAFVVWSYGDALAITGSDGVQAVFSDTHGFNASDPCMRATPIDADGNAGPELEACWDGVEPSTTDDDAKSTGCQVAPAPLSGLLALLPLLGLSRRRTR